MGRRDKPELTPSDADLAEAEAATRLLLAPFDEPRPVPPPPGLSARILAALPDAGPEPRASSPWWAALRPAAWAAAALALLLVAFGAWGVLGDSRGPAQVAGGPDSLIGRTTLTLTLAAKPLLNLLASAGLVALASALAVAVGAWLWWRLAHADREEREP